MPFVVVSPYARQHFVSHTVYDHTSILRFIETRFDLPALTERDANADPMLDLFDFDNPPFMPRRVCRDSKIYRANAKRCAQIPQRGRRLSSVLRSRLPSLLAVLLLVSACGLVHHGRAPLTGPLDVNTASLADLGQLPGVTPSMARRIYEGRPYGSLDELVEHGCSASASSTV